MPDERSSAKRPDPAKKLENIGGGICLGGIGLAAAATPAIAAFAVPVFAVGSLFLVMRALIKKG